MKWEFAQWRKQWLNWLIFPVVLVLLVISYETLLQQKTGQLTIESNRLVNENEFLTQSDTDLENLKQTTHVKHERRLIKRQQLRLHRYSTSLKTNLSNLNVQRLAYYQGMQKHPQLLTQLSAKKIRVQILHDQYLVSHHIPADEAQSSLSPGEFLLKSSGLLSTIMIFMMMIIHVTGIFTRNFSGNNWRLLYTLPLARKQIWQWKDRLAGLLLLTDIAYVNIASFLVSAIFSHQLNGWLYPTIVANRSIQTRGVLVMATFILTLTGGALILNLIHTVGIIIKEQFTTTIILISFIIIGGLFFRNIGTSLFQFINPFTQLGLGSAFATISITLPIMVSCISNLIWILILRCVTYPLDRKAQLG